MLWILEYFVFGIVISIISFTCMGCYEPSALNLIVFRTVLPRWRQKGCVAVGLWEPWRHELAGFSRVRVYLLMCTGRSAIVTCHSLRHVVKAQGFHVERFWEESSSVGTVQW